MAPGPANKGSRQSNRVLLGGGEGGRGEGVELPGPGTGYLPRFLQISDIKYRPMNQGPLPTDPGGKIRDV